MQELFLIKNTEEQYERYLSEIIIQWDSKFQTHSWTTRWMFPRTAIRFTTEEEAQATIEFIINVIDFEKEGYLEIEKVQG